MIYLTNRLPVSKMSTIWKVVIFDYDSKFYYDYHCGEPSKFEQASINPFVYWSIQCIILDGQMHKLHLHSVMLE